MPFSSSAQIGWAPFKTSSPITNEFLPIWIFPSESFLIRFPPETEIPDWSIVVGFVVGPISKVFFVESPILAVVVEPDFVLIRKTNGDIHIGKNSFVIGDDLIDGAHPIWAEDENGTKVPLNIYGSDLQINGVSVQNQIDTNTSNISTNTSNISTNTSNIKNLGEGVAGSTALTAALTALPQTSKESKLSCGVGSGAYSSRYAVSFGCASKVNERVDINAGGSYVFGGSKSYGGGTLDSGVVKAGFVFKLGELNKPTQISMKDKKVMETKIGTLTDKNEKLQNKVSTLMARLERLEKIASRAIKFQDLALIKN